MPSGLDKTSSDRGAGGPGAGSPVAGGGHRGAANQHRGVRKGRWSTSELAWLRENFPRRRDDVLERELGRPAESLRRLAEQVFRGPRATGEWQPSEDAILREGLGVRGEADLAMILRRSESDVRQRLRALSRSAHQGRWTQTEIAEQVGISQVHVSRVLRHALAQLQHLLPAEAPHRPPAQEARRTSTLPARSRTS